MPSTYLRLSLEVAVAVVACALALLTVITREWFEALTRLDPDGGNGSLEWLIVAVLAGVSLIAAVAARSELRQLRSS